jgi:hypothetical protein
MLLFEGIRIEGREKDGRNEKGYKGWSWCMEYRCKWREGVGIFK